MENITASVEEVTLSETTPEEQRESTSCMRFTDNDTAIIYFNYIIYDIVKGGGVME